MRTINEAIEELGFEAVYELYAEYMNSVESRKDWTPFNITPSNYYFEDDSKTGYVLDQYACDEIGVYETFEEAFKMFLSKTQVKKKLLNAVNQ